MTRLINKKRHILLDIRDEFHVNISLYRVLLRDGPFSTGQFEKIKFKAGTSSETVEYSISQSDPSSRLANQQRNIRADPATSITLIRQKFPRQNHIHAIALRVGLALDIH
jgi:hypothetical protein